MFQSWQKKSNALREKQEKLVITQLGILSSSTGCLNLTAFSDSDRKRLYPAILETPKNFTAGEEKCSQS